MSDIMAAQPPRTPPPTRPDFPQNLPQGQQRPGRGVLRPGWLPGLEP